MLTEGLVPSPEESILVAIAFSANALAPKSIPTRIRISTTSAISQPAAAVLALGRAGLPGKRGLLLALLPGWLLHAPCDRLLVPGGLLRGVLPALRPHAARDRLIGPRGLLPVRRLLARLPLLAAVAACAGPARRTGRAARRAAAAAPAIRRCGW